MKYLVIALLLVVSTSGHAQDFIGKDTSVLTANIRKDTSVISKTTFHVKGLDVDAFGTYRGTQDGRIFVRVREWAGIKWDTVFVNYYYREGKVIRYQKVYPYNEYWKGQIWTWLTLNNARWVCGEVWDQYQGNELYSCYYLGDDRLLQYVTDPQQSHIFITFREERVSLK